MPYPHRPTFMRCLLLLFLPLALLQISQFDLTSAQIVDDSTTATKKDAVDETTAENGTAKTLLPPEPTDETAVSTAYFNQKTYSIQDFHELVQGLNSDIRTGFKKVEEENARLSEVIGRLDGRMGKLEGWLDWKWLDRTGLGGWPCLLLTGMAILLLAIALLVLCNTLLIKRVLGGAAAAAASSSARKDKATAGGKKEREMVSLVKEAV